MKLLTHGFASYLCTWLNNLWYSKYWSGCHDSPSNNSCALVCWL